MTRAQVKVADEHALRFLWFIDRCQLPRDVAIVVCLTPTLAAYCVMRGWMNAHTEEKCLTITRSGKREIDLFAKTNGWGDTDE